MSYIPHIQTGLQSKHRCDSFIYGNGLTFVYVVSITVDSSILSSGIMVTSDDSFGCRSEFLTKIVRP